MGKLWTHTSSRAALHEPARPASGRPAGAPMSIKVAVLVGSLRKESINRRLANAVEKLAPETFSFEHVRIDDLPLYNQDFDGDYPAVCKQLKQQIEAADALLFVTPEYHRSVPGLLEY